MSRGQSQMRTRSARAALRRCNNRSHDSTIIVDVDISKIDVIIVDSPESSNCKSRCSKNANRKHFPTVIFIEEDDDDNDNDDDDDVGFRKVDHYATSSRTFHPPSSNSYSFEELDSDEYQMLNRKGKSHKRYSKRMFVTLSSDCSTSQIDTSQRDTLDTEDFEDDCSDCLIMDGSSVDIREEWEKAALKKKREKRCADSKEGIGASGSHMSGVSPYETSEDANLNGTSCDTYTVRNKGEGHSDANNSADRMDVLHSARLSDHTVGECSHETCDPKQRNEPVSGKTFPHRCHSQPNVSSYHEEMGNSCGQDVPLQGPLSRETWMHHGSHSQIDGVCSLDTEDNKRASLFTTELRDESQCEDRQRHENLSPCNRPGSSQNMPGPQTGNVTEVAKDSFNFQPQDEHASGGEEAVFQGSMGNIQGDMNPAMIQQSNGENMDIVSDKKNDIIGKWERFKESDEYKRVEEEEWAARKRELLIQSEEAQRLRRLRKRKKAESLRLLDMEKRQKQRLEEIRESQKRDEETINLKEQIRVEIQKELKKLEMAHRDMASLLRGLGINVSGGLYPLPHEVNAAYKQALLRFHPDRASRADIRQQVEAEEKFKLISRLKEKLLPVA